MGRRLAYANLTFANFALATFRANKCGNGLE